MADDREGLEAVFMLDCQDNGPSVRDAGERRQIQTELDAAQAELTAAVALRNEAVDWEPVDLH